MYSPYDLHSHSTCSDGTLTPAALVQRAAAAGVHALALTDHDTTAGIAAARQAAAGTALTLIPGVEISVTWQGGTVHVLGLGIDPDSPPLLQGLATIQHYRHWRAEEIGHSLAAAGIADAYADARALAQGANVGRTHFAQVLVARGRARNVRDVFKRYLVRGKPGHVASEWATLADALAWIRAAGGMPVIAHPARYRLASPRLAALLREFRDGGGAGIEVVSGSHAKTDYPVMAELAARHGLLASAGSDYHGPEHAWFELGRLPTLPPSCQPVWSAWPELTPATPDQ